MRTKLASDRLGQVWLVMAVALVMLFVAGLTHAGGMSQGTVPGNLKYDLRPLAGRCAGPMRPGQKHPNQQCSGTNGVLYFINFVSVADTVYEWTVTADIVPPTPGISVMIGCDPSKLKDPSQCGKVNELEASKQPLRLAPGQRVPQYPIEALVDPSASPPFARQVMLHVCVTRTGRAEPICFQRPFTTDGGTTKPH